MPRQPSPEQLERQTDLLAVLHHISGSLTDWVAQTRGQQINHVLLNRLALIGADGNSSHSFSVPYGSVAIQNLGAHQMTIAGDGPQLGAPVRGIGVHIIPAGSSAVINLTGRDLTIYGTAGDFANLQVFSIPQQPAYGGGTGTAAATGSSSAITGTGSAASAAATAVLTTVATGVATAAVLPANANRKGLIVANETTPAYLAYAAAATTAAYTVLLPPGAYWEAPTPIYTGPLSVIAPAGVGALRVTELT